MSRDMPEMSPDPTTPRRALVVDDDLLIGGWVARVLGRNGYVTHTAADGLAGLQVLDGLSVVGMDVSLLVVDSEMPVMDGLAMIEQVRERMDGASMRIVLMSGSDGPTTGADVFIAKPFEADELIASIGSEHRPERA